MLPDPALPEGGHLGVTLPNLPNHVSTLPGNCADIAAIFYTL